MGLGINPLPAYYPPAANVAAWDAHMERTRQRIDSAAQHVTRRRAIAGGATLLTAGGTLVWVGDSASAAVTIDGWTVPDASFEAETVDPVVNADVKYRYDVGDASIRALALELLVGDHTVASDELVTDRTSLESTVTLSGPLTDSDAWSASDFDVAVGESVSRDVTVAVRFAVLDTNDSELVTDRAEDTSTVTITHPQDSTYSATVGGSASITDGSA